MKKTAFAAVPLAVLLVATVGQTQDAPKFPFDAALVNSLGFRTTPGNGENFVIAGNKYLDKGSRIRITGANGPVFQANTQCQAEFQGKSGWIRCDKASDFTIVTAAPAITTAGNPNATTAMTMAQATAKGTMPAFKLKADACPKIDKEPKEKGDDLCKDGKTENGTCGTLSGPRSDRCVNEALNAGVRDANGKPVNYTYFGLDDCRAGYYRDIKLITKLVVHNGGYTAKMNSDLFKCDNPFPTHYTIERDGSIYQMVGEERHTWHANDESRGAIGIEMNIDSVPDPDGKGRTSCNSLGDKGKAPGTKANILAACTPTAAQYTSLRNLLGAIEARTGVTHDKDHVIGHCEAKSATHGDPKGFDWRELSLSNADKLAKVKATNRTGTCWAYDLFP